MSKLVDKERLARLAAALDARAKAAVKAEEERAVAVEEKLRTDVDAKVATATYDAKVADLEKEDQRIAGLVSTEAQTRENADNALDQRLKEVEDIVGDGSSGSLGTIVQQVNANKTAIETLNGDASKAGSVAKAVADAKKAIEDAQKEINDDIEGRMDTVEAFVAAQPAKDQAQDEKITALENKFKGENSIEAQIAAAEAAAKKYADDKDTADKTAQGLVDAEQDRRLGLLEAKFEGDQSVDAKIAAAQAAAEAKAAALDKTDRDAQALVDKAQDDKIAALEEFKDAHTHQDIEQDIDDIEAKLVGLEKDTVQAAIDQAEADAKAHAEQKIADLIDSAPEAMNTLNELATAIKNNKDVYDGYVAEHATAMANMKKELQDEIDTDVKVVADELAKQKDANQEGTLAKQIADEVTRAKAEEADIRADFAAEDQKLANQIKAVEEMLGLDSGEGETGAFAQVQADIAALQETVGDAQEGLVKDVADLQAADVTLQANIDLKVDQADYDTKVAALENADTALSDRIKVFEAGGAQDVAAKETRLAAAESDIDALQAFMNGHSHDSLTQAIQANAAAIEAEVEEGGARDVAIKAAIDKEVLDRDAAIAEELKAYSDTAAVKAMLTNVINSLGLAIEDNKLQLTLGTSDYVIKEVELDLATDADIDAIIAGLDA